MFSPRILSKIYKQKPRSSSIFCTSSGYRYVNAPLTRTPNRSISSTTSLQFSWMDTIKGVFTGKKTSPDESKFSAESFTLLSKFLSLPSIQFITFPSNRFQIISLYVCVLHIYKYICMYIVYAGNEMKWLDRNVLVMVITGLGFADELKNARKLGTFKQYMVGRSSQATFADAFEKQEAIIRYLGGCDPTGEVCLFCLFLTLKIYFPLFLLGLWLWKCLCSMLPLM